MFNSIVFGKNNNTSLKLLLVYVSIAVVCMLYVAIMM